MLNNISKSQNIEQQSEAFPLQQRLRESQAQSQEQSNLSERDTQRLKSISIFAAQALPMMQSGDLEGVKALANKRISELDSQGIPSNDTTEFLGLLESNPELATQRLSQGVDLGNKLGLFAGSQGVVASLQERQSLLNDLEGGVDPKTGKLKSRKQLTPKQLSAAVALGLEFRQPIPASVFGDRKKEQLDAEFQIKPQLEAAITTAREQAKIDVKKRVELPKANARLAQLTSQADNAISLVDKALSKSGVLSTGFIGAFTGKLPGTDAFELRKTIESIQANLAFDKLQEMRNNSPTGGAVGQLSDSERVALSATVASLDTGLDDEALIENLIRVKDQYDRFKQALQVAHESQFGQVQDSQKAPQAKIGRFNVVVE
jgi:hypothetical protein